MKFLKYAGKRLLALIPVLLGISMIAFALGLIAPGDAVDQMFSDDSGVVSQEVMDQVREDLGLNDPMLVQYGRWLLRVLQGDFGESYLDKTDIRTEILRYLPVTAKLAAYSLLLTAFWGIVVGLVRARFRGGWIDSLIGTIMICVTSLPGFWLAILLIYWFAETLRILPTSGIGTIQQMIMPTIVLSCGSIGRISRVMRSSLSGELGKSYVVTARSMGASSNTVVFREALPNALNAVIVLLGTHLGAVLGGSTIVEQIFAIPGLGSYAIGAIGGRDYPVIQAYVLFTGAVYVIANFLIDLLCFFINPKTRLGGYMQ